MSSEPNPCPTPNSTTITIDTNLVFKTVKYSINGCQYTQLANSTTLWSGLFQMLLTQAEQYPFWIQFQGHVGQGDLPEWATKEYGIVFFRCEATQTPESFPLPDGVSYDACHPGVFWLGAIPLIWGYKRDYSSHTMEDTLDFIFRSMMHTQKADPTLTKYEIFCSSDQEVLPGKPGELPGQPWNGYGPMNFMVGQ
jgi:hypothetical protein